MIISKLSYSENIGTPQEWLLNDLHLGKINLLVGKNAVGKSRTLNIIGNLAKTMTGKFSRLPDGNWDITFEKNNKKYIYKLKISNNNVEEEELSLNEKKLIIRNKKEKRINFSQENKLRDFHPPENKLTVQVRRDQKEHPFLDDLSEWAENLHHFTFSGARVNDLTIVGNIEQIQDKNFPLSLNIVPLILRDALEQKNIKKEIIKDFNLIGYEIKNVYVGNLEPGFPPNVLCLVIQEKDLNCPTLQTSMYPGMFRAFSLIVIINYVISLDKKCTILIDDIGEGLDY